MEVDAPVAGVSLDIWLSYLFKNKNLEIPAPLCVSPRIRAGRSGPSTFPERGKNNVLVLLLSPSSQEKAGWWTLPTLPVRRLPLLHVPRPGKPLRPVPSQRRSRTGRQAGKPTGRRDGVQLVWFQAF